MRRTSARVDEAALDAALSSGRGTPRERMAWHLEAAALREGQPDEAAFHRTHAMVHALEAGNWAEAERLRGLLAAEGRA